MRILSIQLLVPLFCASSPVTANPLNLQSLEEIASDIRGFLSSQGGVTNSVRFQIDPRLRLKKCPEKLTFKMHLEDMVLAKCPSLGWKLTVPLQNSSKSLSSTSSRAISRGQTVRLEIRKSGFVISRSMIADRSGKVGDFIPVRASRRSQSIVVQISGPGQVILASN